jgi:dienelactone hydrolase
VFPSRKKLNFEQGDIHAWYLRHPTEDRPSIIVIHGFRISKKHPNIILTINLLFSAGYDVLAIDMRSHGSSFKTQTLTATFGHGEHLDVLGAVDFLYSRNVTRVGAYGESMGGATLLTALSQDTRIQAGYANSPVCDLEALVRLHFSLYGKWLSPVIFYSAKIASRVLGLGMFPPFDFNPKECASQIGSGRAVFFDHAYGDVIVPVSHSELCSKIAEESGATVERFYFDTHAATPPSTLSMCHDHCLQGIVDAVGYKKRLTDFFNKYLN